MLSFGVHLLLEQSLVLLLLGNVGLGAGVHPKNCPDLGTTESGIYIYKQAKLNEIRNTLRMRKWLKIM